MDRINILVLNQFSNTSFIKSLNLRESSEIVSTKIKFYKFYYKSEFDDTQLDLFNILIANSITDLNNLSVKKDDFHYIFLQEEYSNQKNLN